MSGGKGGRPKLPEGSAKDAVVNVRMAVEEKAWVESAAKSAGLSVSEWSRAALVSAAEAAYIIPALQKAILDLHGCASTFVEVAHVTNPAMPASWDGEVFTFDINGHPLATRAYAWSYINERAKRSFVATLAVGPATSPESAVAVHLASKSGAAR